MKKKRVGEYAVVSNFVPLTKKEQEEKANSFPPTFLKSQEI